MPSCDETEASDTAPGATEDTREARVNTMMEVVERQYRNLCVELNLDPETTEESECADPRIQKRVSSQIQEYRRE